MAHDEDAALVDEAPAGIIKSCCFCSPVPSPFFLLFGFNEGTEKGKGQKGTTQEPSWSLSVEPDASRGIQKPTLLRVVLSDLIKGS